MQACTNGGSSLIHSADICRYVDKDALQEIHERSTPYLRLKDDIKSEGIEYTSVISQSYYEQDLGFMETKF